MKRKIATYLLALTALTACTNDEYIGDGIVDAPDGRAIGFAPGVEAVSRAATGAAAATALGGTFYVYGIKNETMTGAGHLSNENLVFDNYKVTFADGTASTTTSNTAGWEYVGQSLSDKEVANITDNSGTRTQTIKYWDPNAADYTYYAFAAKSTDIANDNVKVEKLTNNTGLSYDNGYSVTFSADASLADLYFADRKHVGSADYNKAVTFSFRNIMAKVRVGMYSTIPGYTVTIDGFEVAEASAAPTFGDMTTVKEGQFAANLASNKPGKASTLTVTYKDNSSTEENRPVVTIADADKDKVLYLGDNLKNGTQLTTSSANLVYDKAGGGYTDVFPMEGNVNNLKLKVNYTLRSTIGETIEVKHATAEVPAQYLQWKPGCAYTYIFKVNDQTNGIIGSLTGLHPITFEAVAITDGTGEDELISTTTPTNYNIITIGCNESTHKVTVGQDDYHVGDAVYAVVIAANTVVTDLSATTKLYEVTTDDYHSNPITEAAVENYLKHYLADPTIVDQPVTAIPAASGVASYVTTVPKGDDTADKNTLDAMKWTAERKVYAVEYTEPATSAKYYKVVRVDGFSGEFECVLTLSPSVIGNTGGTMTPTFTVGGTAIDNANVTYTLDTAGTYGKAVPTTVTINADKTITVPASTDAGTYTVVANYNRRTYTATFSVSQ